MLKSKHSGFPRPVQGTPTSSAAGMRTLESKDQVNGTASCPNLNPVSSQLSNLNPQLAICLDDLVLRDPGIPWGRINKTRLHKALSPTVQLDKVDKISLIISQGPPGKGIPKKKVRARTASNLASFLFTLTLPKASIVMLRSSLEPCDRTSCSLGGHL